MSRNAVKRLATLLGLTYTRSVLIIVVRVLEFTLNRPVGQMTPTRGLKEVRFFGVALLNDVLQTVELISRISLVV